MSETYSVNQREPLKVADRETESHGSFSDVLRSATAWLRKRGLIVDPHDAHASMNVPGARYGRRGGPRSKRAQARRIETAEAQRRRGGKP